jgi:hypothetical protein
MPDLDSLIREVLEMVKDEQKKKNFGNNAYAREAAEAAQYAKEARDEYNKMYEPPGSTTALDRAAKLKEREMINTGAITLENTKSAGELARQGLMNEGELGVANINKEGTIYSADQGYKGKQMEADARKYQGDQTFAASKYATDAGGKGVSGDQLKAATTIMEDMNSSPEDKKMASDFIKRSFRSNVNRVPGSEFVKPDTATPRETTVNIPSPSSAIKPTRGAQSMTFDTNMGTAGKNPLREKEETEDVFYRRNPGIKKKKEDSLFRF